MFIIVKYGNNETLLCNPTCAVINLLTSIKRRAGYGNSNVIVDLSDETGLVKELDNHQMEYANKYLTSHETYILVKKELASDNVSVESGSTPRSQNYQYKPLLEKFDEIFPNYRLHVDHIPTKVVKKRGGKSPSPAGRFTAKQANKKSVDPPKSRASGKKKS
ncbi:hypothetical protein FSP39_009119 [Pinctada imbricata]|uniref:Uncharacterized protein n=1 Tax=Pinctada imbricata TaxID=66713 RepID=A0AA88XW13_PINIB|nr:hypothetical protein FSP39_009119 [Pinctada imbricata]